MALISLHIGLGRGPGGGLPYENDGDARRKIRIEPLKETNLGVVQVLFDP